MPLFSFIIPVFNRANLLIETLNSILDQSFTDYEIIVINDGSTDNLDLALKSYLKKIRLINQDNLGCETARNNGAKYASGKYFIFLDSDDLLFKWTLYTYSKILRINPDAEMLIGKAKLFKSNEELNNISISETTNYLVYSNYASKEKSFFHTSSIIVIRHDIFPKIGGFRNSKADNFNGSDLNFFLKASDRGPIIHIVEPYTIAYRIHNSNSVNNIKRIVKGVNSLIISERKNSYPGGDQLKAKRYSLIGGSAWYWSLTAIKKGEVFAGLFLLLNGSKMICYGAARKLYLLAKRSRITSVSNLDYPHKNF